MIGCRVPTRLMGVNARSPHDGENVRRVTHQHASGVEISTYAFGKTVASDFATAVTRVTEELGKVGFGVLSEIDVAATLKKKLGVEISPYRILGACNPQFASQALALEPQIGVLLPCNVVVRQDKTGAVYVEFMDPNAVLRLVHQPQIEVIAAEVRGRLVQVMNAL
jgi:uncharacterized protein (DUF302 family)